MLRSQNTHMPNKTRKSADRLTAHQLKAFREVEEIASMTKLDYPYILAHKRDARTPIIEHMRRTMTLSEVITRYTLVDEYLNLTLCHYFFGRNKSTIKLWKTKKFRLFNHHVMEELSLMAKFRFAKSIARMPKGVAGDIDRLNALRNGLAHAFFPENLKRSKPEWKGKSVFSKDGFRAFLDDMGKIANYFWSIDTDRLVLDFDVEPEEQENSAAMPGSVEQKLA
jgi:hypothetical protein